MRHLLDTLGGLFQLALIAIRSRFRLRNAYWSWRRETAFGSNPDAIPRGERMRQIMAYARWVHRMKRMR